MRSHRTTPALFTNCSLSTLREKLPGWRSIRRADMFQRLVWMEIWFVDCCAYLVYLSRPVSDTVFYTEDVPIIELIFNVLCLKFVLLPWWKWHFTHLTLKLIMSPVVCSCSMTWAWWWVAVVCWERSCVCWKCGGVCGLIFSAWAVWTLGKNSR